MSQYLFPHVSTKITDNSFIQNRASSTGTILFQPFISEKGIDNKIVQIENTKSYIENYGKPNYRNYGQPGYHVYNWLNSGGRVWGMRVMPEDATYSNLILNFKTRVKESSEATPVQAAYTVPNVRFAVVDDKESGKKIVKPVVDGKIVEPSTVEPKVVKTTDTKPVFDPSADKKETTPTVAKPEVKPEIKPTIPEVKPAVPSTGNVTPSVTKPAEVKPEVKPVVKPEVKPAVPSKTVIDHDKGTLIPTHETIPTHVVDGNTGKIEPTHIADKDGKIVPSHTVAPTHVVDNNTGKTIVPTHVVDHTGTTIPTSPVNPTHKVDVTGHAVANKDVPDHIIKPLDPKQSSNTNTGKPVEPANKIDTTGKLVPVKPEVKPSSPVVKKTKSSTVTVNHDGTTTSTKNTTKTTPAPTPVEMCIEAVYLPQLTSGSSFADLITGLDDTSTDANGVLWDNHYLYAFRTVGRGQYGNNYSVKITPNQNFIKSFGYRCYNISILETTPSTGTIVKDGPFLFSTFEGALSSSGSSNFIGNILGAYNEDINFTYNIDGYNSLVSTLKQADPDLTLENIDFLFGLDTNSNYYKNITIAEDSIELNSFSGIFLSEGSEGNIEIVNQNPNTTERKANVTALYNAAYNGLIDEGVNNKKVYPIDVILDASYDVSVKQSMFNLTNVARNDIFPFFDAGFLPNYSSLTSWRENFFDLNTYTGALNGMTCKVNDPFGSVSIPVTYTYLMSQYLPVHDNVYGVQRPIAGSKYGILNGIVDGTLNFSPTDMQKSDLLSNQINYITKVGSSTQLSTQITLQQNNSALSEINHVRSLFRMVRTAETIAENYLFEFASAETLSSFQSELDGALVSWVNNGCCSSITASVTQSPYEASMKTCSVVLGIKFTGILEIINIKVNVNR